MSKSRYVAGFLFNKDYTQVALVRKERPEWQRGKLNGIGGKVEKGETFDEAMTREFMEETGYLTHTWDRFCKLEGHDYIVMFYSSIVFTDDLKDVVRTMESEEIEVQPVSISIMESQIVPNLTWLIPMAMQVKTTYANVTDK